MRPWWSWNIASSSGWARKRAPPCARTWTAAGPACWSTSRTKPRRRTDRRRQAAPDNTEFHIARNPNSTSQGERHDHRALRLSAEPARLQGDGGRQPSRPRLRDSLPRFAQGHAQEPAIRRAQSQYAHADAQGWRLRAVGVERNPAISRRKETR